MIQTTPPAAYRQSMKGLKALKHEARAFRPGSGPAEPRPERSAANAASEPAGNLSGRVSFAPQHRAEPERSGDSRRQPLCFVLSGLQPVRMPESHEIEVNAAFTLLGGRSSAKTLLGGRSSAKPPLRSLQRRPQARHLKKIPSSNDFTALD
jgi:hypothetical protein